MIQQVPSSGTLLSQYAGVDFFGSTGTDAIHDPLGGWALCNVEILPSSEAATVGEPFPLQCELRGPWGQPIQAEPFAVWSTDVGTLAVDPQDPLRAALTVSEAVVATVTCMLPDLGVQTSLAIGVETPSE